MIGVDFDGTLIARAVADEAGRRWFSYLAERLNDPAILTSASVDFFPPLLAAMARLNGKEALTPEDRGRYLFEAREYYKTLYLEIVAEHGGALLNRKLVARLTALRTHGKELALISGTQQSILEPTLAILGISDLFVVVFGEEQHLLLPKEDLLRRFIKQHGSLELYIGDEDKDELACSSLGIPFERVGRG